MSLVIRSKVQMDPSSVFWYKIERIYGEIPKLIRMILEFNGFDTYLALKGIQWDDKQYFFQALEESIIGIAELDDSDHLKIKFQEELRANNQSMEKFRLKLGHKNLIINLCNELQKTQIDDFNNATYATVKIPDLKREQTELIVRQKQPGEEHGYSREDNDEEHLLESPQPKRIKYDSIGSRCDMQEIASPETNEQIQYIYETEEDDGSQFIDQEYVDDEGEIVEYQEISAEDIDPSNSIYSAEQLVKTEAGTYEQCFEISDYEHHSQGSMNRSMEMKNSKKPKHMYTEEFLQMQIGHGRVGTPGRRRPKIQKNYPETEEGLMEKWKDLVRQSCEVIVPTDLLNRFDLEHIDIVKIQTNIWEVKCPMCTKKLRLQLTHEGKYVNFKRSNFERHLRIVHYKQILVFKSEEDNSEHFEEHTE
ncbi:uncharacterized protein [Chironomus tepperi]|uniref:uncharacterized protein n=1 Tax=Chironomus tepperi TaxID=113505 RepID=UPI00391F44EC